MSFGLIKLIGIQRGSNIAGWFQDYPFNHSRKYIDCVLPFNTLGQPDYFQKNCLDGNAFIEQPDGWATKLLMIRIRHQYFLSLQMVVAAGDEKDPNGDLTVIIQQTIASWPIVTKNISITPPPAPKFIIDPFGTRLNVTDWSK